MKLGTQTGSLTNHVYSRMTIGQPDPTVGMGATILAWTDRHPATIVEASKVRGRWLIVVQEDHAKRVDNNGLSESQTYEYSENLAGAKTTFMQMPGGGWSIVFKNPETKRWNKIDGNGLRIGEREKYRDFSF